MTDATSTIAPLDLALRRVQRSVLATLAVCAIVIFSQEQAADARPERIHALVAVGLALLCIVTRRVGSVATIGMRLRVALVVASLASALAIGIAGVVISAAGGGRQTALLFTLAAAIFCLGRPRLLGRPEAGSKP